jgi:hypothetical protein
MYRFDNKVVTNEHFQSFANIPEGFALNEIDLSPYGYAVSSISRTIGTTFVA